MSLTTPSPAATSDSLPPRLRNIIAGLGKRDFSKPAEPGEPDGAEALFMLSDAELKKERDEDSTKALVSQVNSWRARCASARLPYERTWLKAIDMYEGRQFTEWSRDQRRMIEAPLPDGRVRIPMNVCQPIIRTEVAKTTSSHPMASVQPASNDDEDLLAARAAEAAWEWYNASERLQTRTLNLANHWRSLTGNGFVKTFYDQSAIDTAAVAAAKLEYRKQQAADAPDAGAGMSPLAAALGLAPTNIPAPPPGPVYGKVTSENVSPFHLYVPDLGEPDIQRQSYLIHVSYIGKERAKMVYGGSMPEDWDPPTVDPSEVYQVNVPGAYVDTTATSELVRVVEAWVKPGATRHLPKGGLVVLIDDQLVGLAKDGLPYEHGEYPFAHIYTVETGRFYRMSVLEAVIPLQQELNRIFAQLVEYKNLTASPMYLYRQGSLNPRQIRTRPGTWIPINFGAEYPTPLQLPAIPQYVTGLIDTIKQYLDDISGQHQVSRAISPGADTAASAIQILREADDDYLSNTLDSIEVAVETVARHALVLMVQFWDEPRLIKVAGPSEAVSARALTGAELATGTDIRTTVGTGLPQSRSARQAFITELMDKGYIPPSIGLQAIEAGALGKLFQVLQVDEQQAERENVEMTTLITEAEYQEWEASQQPPVDPEAGMPMEGAEDIDPLTGQPAPQPIFYPINDFDNHPVHIEVIERKMKSQEWRSLPQWRKDVMLAHRQAHVEAVAGFMMRQQAQQAMAGADASAQSGESEYAGPEPAPAASPAPPEETLE